MRIQCGRNNANKIHIIGLVWTGLYCGLIQLELDQSCHCNVVHLEVFCVPVHHDVFYFLPESPDDDHYEEQDYPLVVGEDQTQVAAGPDAESTVEQITYLTSWPATTSPAHQTSMDIITMPTTTMSMLSAVGAPVHQSLQQVVEQRRGEEGYQIAFQPVRDYSQH